MKFSLLILFLNIYSPLVVKQTPLSDAEIKEFRAMWSREMTATKTLEAKFSQSKRFEFHNDVARSSGKLYYAAPHQIRWEYTEPHSVLIFGKEQLKNNRLKALNDLIKKGFHSDQLFDPALSQVSYFKTDQGYRVVLQPKDRQARRYIRNISIDIALQPWEIKSIKISTPSGDETLIRFSETRKNHSLPPSLF